MLSPRIAHRTARRATWGLGLLTVALFATWAHPWTEDTRLMLAVYFTAALGFVCSLCLTVLTGCFQSVEDAFTAGLHTGRACPECHEHNGRPALRPLRR